MKREVEMEVGTLHLDLTLGLVEAQVPTEGWLTCTPQVGSRSDFLDKVLQVKFRDTWTRELNLEGENLKNSGNEVFEEF